MRQPTKSILSYWRSIAGDGVPAKSAVDPRALKPHLPDLFILERMDRAVFAFRLAGTRLCTRYGRELRDHDFLRLWPAAQQGEILTRLTRCLQSNQPLTLTGAAATLDGDPVPFTVLLMPLRDVNGHVTCLLGAMTAYDERSLREGGVITSQRLESAQSDVMLEAAEAQSSQAFTTGRATGVSFLRIVDGWKEERGIGRTASINGNSSIAS